MPLLKMERYTFQQRIEIINIHYKNGENLTVTGRKTKAFLSRREAPCRTAIQKLVDKFELLGQVSDVKNKTRARHSTTTENIAAVALGPYFFENEVGSTLTVNGLRYREMINDFLWPELDGIDLDNVYFQQDGTTCHTSNETIALLREKFPDRVMS